MTQCGQGHINSLRIGMAKPERQPWLEGWNSEPGDISLTSSREGARDSALPHEPWFKIPGPQSEGSSLCCQYSVFTATAQCQKSNVPLSTQRLHVWNSQVQVCPLHRFLWWALTCILLLLTTTTVILRMAHSWVLCTVLMNYQSWGSPWGPPDLWPDRSESGPRDPKFAARVRSEGSPVWTVPPTLQSSKLHSYCQSHWLFLSSSVMSESLQPPGLQHTRFPFNLLNL